MTQKNWFKAHTPEDRSGDILVSFSRQWSKKIGDRKIGVIFRRRIPHTFSPKRLYIYLGAPASALVGFSNVLEILNVDLQGALKLAKPSGLTEKDIRKYLAGHETIGCYQIGGISLFENAIPLNELREITGFNPPQSFVSLSKKAADWLLYLPSTPSDLRATLVSPFVDEGAGVR